MASSRITWPIEMPSCSLCVTARTKARIDGTSQRCSMFVSAAGMVRPSSCSCSVSRSSSPSGPVMRSPERWSAALKPIPASSVTMRRSISSGSSTSICSVRRRARDLMRNMGAIQPTAQPYPATITATNGDQDALAALHSDSTASTAAKITR